MLSWETEEKKRWNPFLLHFCTINVQVQTHLCRPEQCKPSSHRRTHTCYTPSEFQPHLQTLHLPEHILYAPTEQNRQTNVSEKATARLSLYTWQVVDTNACSHSNEVLNLTLNIVGINSEGVFTSFIGVIGGSQTVDKLLQTQLPVCVFIRKLNQSINTQRSEGQKSQSEPALQPERQNTDASDVFRMWVHLCATKMWCLDCTRTSVGH